jgi:hypothetical protein
MLVSEVCQKTMSAVFRYPEPVVPHIAPRNGRVRYAVNATHQDQSQDSNPQTRDCENPRCSAYGCTWVYALQVRLFPSAHLGNYSWRLHSKFKIWRLATSRSASCRYHGRCQSMQLGGICESCVASQVTSISRVPCARRRAESKCSFNMAVVF